MFCEKRRSAPAGAPARPRLSRHCGGCCSNQATNKAAAAANTVTSVNASNLATVVAAVAAAATANTAASAANTTTYPGTPATIAAQNATQSATSATNSAVSAVSNANAAASVSGANTSGTTANTYATAAATAAVTATLAASTANTAAAAANANAANANTAAVTTAVTTAATAAITAATAATSAQTAAQLAGVVRGTTRFPGLWLIDGPNNTPTTNFNQSFNAYGLVTNTPATSLWTSPGKIATQIEVPNSVSKTPPPFPMYNCLPTMPALPSFLNSVDLATRIIKNGDVTFPTDSDKADTDGIYRYYASDLNLQGNTMVRFKASAKVIVYLQGDMITKGNIDIKPCEGAATCNLNNLVIYGYKSNGQLLIKGTNTVGAFIIAPTYSAGVAGGGNGEGYKGALWA